MKTILVSLLVLVGLNSLHTQSTWVKTFGTLGNDEGKWIISSKSDDYIICGFSTNPVNTEKKATLLKLNEEGEIVWDKQLDLPGYDSELRRIIEIPDGSIIGIGIVTNRSNGNIDALVTKHNTSGDLIWAKAFGGSSEEWGYNAIWTQNSIVVAGRTRSYGSGDMDIFLLKLSDSGALIWCNSFGGPENDWPGDLVESLDGNIIVCANSKSYGSFDLHDILHFKIDQSGNLISSTSNGRDDNDGMNQLLRLNDGSLLGMDASWTDGGDRLDGWLFKMDDNAQHIWSKLIVLGSQSIHLFVSESPTNGELIGTIYDHVPNAQSEAIIVKFDKNGNLLFSKEYGGEYEDNLRYAISTSDGGIMAVGMSKSFGHSSTEILVVKTDENGNVENCCTKDVNLIINQGTVVNKSATPDMIPFSSSYPIQGTSINLQSSTLLNCQNFGAEFSLSDSILCIGDCLQAQNENIQTNLNYEWHFEGAANPVSFAAQPTAVCYPSAGNYLITLEVSNGECSESKEVSILVELTTDMVVDTIQLCPGESIFLNNAWQTAPGEVSDTITTGNGCIAIERTILELINEKITIDSIPLCPGDSVFFQNNWIYEPHTFNVISGTTQECDIILRTIIYQPLAGCPVYCSIYWPNIFTPDDSGVNGKWFPFINCPVTNFSLKIFDRWGDLIWETNNPESKGWDGEWKNMKLNSGVFIYFAEYDTFEVTGGKPKHVLTKGDITLIR